MNSDTELFLDRSKISWEHNVERRLCRPVKCDANPILVPEHPWEQSFVTLYGSILPREDGSGFRMWYMAGAKGARKDQTMCYAESGDGVAWQKVFFDLCPYDDIARTNILLGPDPNIHGPCVLRNEHSADPAERYLAFYDSYTKYRPAWKELAGTSRCCFTVTSPDGIRWSPSHGRLAVPGKSDTGQSVVYDPSSRRYMAYFRGGRASHDPFAGPYGETNRVRYVRMATSPDFLHWSDAVELLRADERDGDPDHQFHQFSVTRRGGQFVGLLSLFHIDSFLRMADEDGQPILMEEGTCDTQLAASRDGVHWTRVGDREVFLPLGEPGQWDSTWITTASHIVYHNDQMLFYYAGAGHKRSEGHQTKIGLATLPADRFQALRPRKMCQAAVIETKPLAFGQGDLAINADASHGKITAELCEFEGRTIDGFAKENCDPVTTDGLNHMIRWKGKRLADAHPNPHAPGIRIRFYLQQADLYAMHLPV